MRSVNLQSKQPMPSNAPPASSISPTCEPLPMELEGEVPLHKKSSHGKDSQSESNLPTPYVSAPSSPARSNTAFIATPTSPVVAFSDPSPEFQQSPAAKSARDDFEFEMSTTPESPCNEEPQKIMQQQQQQRQRQQKRDVPTLPFADELFSNGQLRPLKLPPRLQGGSKPSSRVYSPTRLQRGASGYTYGHSLKKKDFDPFAAALEEIRKDKTWFEQAPPPPHRTQTVAPLKSLPWSCCGHEKEMGPSGPPWQVEWVPKRHTEQEKGNQDLEGPTEPRLKLVPPGHYNVRASAFSGPANGRRGYSIKVVRRWRSLVPLAKREITRDRQIQSASDRWAYAWDEARDPVAMATRAKDELSRPSFGKLQSAQKKVEEGVQHRAAEMKALTKYKPNKLLLCFGFNSRG